MTRLRISISVLGLVVVLLSGAKLGAATTSIYGCFQSNGVKTTRPLQDAQPLCATGNHSLNVTTTTAYGCFQSNGVQTTRLLQETQPLCATGNHWVNVSTTTTYGCFQPNGVQTTRPLQLAGPVCATGNHFVNIATGEIQQACHSGDPLAGVTNPSRLTVTNSCVTITGTVCQDEFNETDGDKAFDVIVDSQYTYLLKSTNINQCAQVDNRLALHVETVPQADAGSVFYSPVTETLALKVGDRVSVTGPLVQDTNHGDWTEIHPTEFVSVL